MGQATSPLPFLCEALSKILKTPSNFFSEPFDAPSMGEDLNNLTISQPLYGFFFCQFCMVVCRTTRFSNLISVLILNTNVHFNIVLHLSNGREGVEMGAAPFSAQEWGGPKGPGLACYSRMTLPGSQLAHSLQCLPSSDGGDSLEAPPHCFPGLNLWQRALF